MVCPGRKRFSRIIGPAAGIRAWKNGNPLHPILPRLRAGSAGLGVLLITALLAQGCGAAAPATSAGAQTAGRATASPTPFMPVSATATVPPPTATPTATDTSTPTPTRAPLAWRDYPVIPEVTDRARAIYTLGQSLGNNPHAFSVIGDCEGTPSRFLGVFDYSPAYYRLGEYAYLQEAIEYFAGYFGRISRAAHDSFTTSSVLSPLWAHPSYCLSGESPLACELRINKPSFALVMVGTMDYRNPPRFEPQMRIILDTLLQNGTIPILYTKASNWEGDWSINASIGRLAYEYDAPLWNFWRAIQPLPWHGLQADGLHISWAANYFDDPYCMRHGWPWRNLTALQALDSVWRGVAPAE